MSKANVILEAELKEAELKEALEALKNVLDNYRSNGRKGIGMGPLFKASRILRKHGLVGGENNG